MFPPYHKAFSNCLEGTCDHFSPSQSRLPLPPPLLAHSLLQIARDEKLATQTKEHEARMARALERAAAPVFRKVGKPMMFRSAPLKKREVVATDTGADDEVELEAYLARDMF